MVASLCELAHHVLPEPIDDALAGECDQRDLTRLAGLEAHRGAGRNVETHAARLGAIEFQRRVGLEEMVVRAHLDRPIAGIRHRQRDGLAAGIELDLTITDEVFAGDHQIPCLSSFPGAAQRRARNPYPPSVVMDSGTRAAPSAGMTTERHRIGSCTVTSLVPSGNVASTWMSWIISGMPSITWARVSTWAPVCISSATVLPSRAPSRMKSVMSATASGWLSLTPRSSRRRATMAAMAIMSLSFSRGVRFMSPPVSGIQPEARQRHAERRQCGGEVVAQGRAVAGDEARHGKAIPGRGSDLATEMRERAHG